MYKVSHGSTVCYNKSLDPFSLLGNWLKEHPHSCVLHNCKKKGNEKVLYSCEKRESEAFFYTEEEGNRRRMSSCLCFQEDNLKGQIKK